jgi:hypothetical protein
MIGRTFLERSAPVVLLVPWAGAGPRNVRIRRPGGELAVGPSGGSRGVHDGT